MVVPLTRKVMIEDEPLLVRMDQRKMEAHLAMRKGGVWDASERSFKQLFVKLTKMGFREIDEEGIRENIKKVLEGDTFCFCRGVEPVHGSDAGVQYTFNDNSIFEQWEADESERIDFHELNTINNVKIGDLLAERSLPTPGKPGRNVFNDEIVPKKGHDKRIIAGKNVRLSDDELKAYATADGCVKRVRNRISVDQIMQVKQDVDFHTGNIKFNGDVIVKGDVKETFHIEAEGSITIHGCVDHAALKSKGHITIEKGIFGKEKVVIEAEGDISFAFAENANLKAGGNIYAQKSMINCHTFAGEKVFLSSGGKSLIGGHTVALMGLRATTLGNPKNDVPTIIEFGVRAEMLDRYKALAHEVQRMKLTSDEPDPERMHEIMIELQQIREDMEKQKKAKVMVEKSTYPGVELRSGKAVFKVPTEISQMTYYKIPGRDEILTRGYVPGEEDVPDDADIIQPHDEIL